MLFAQCRIHHMTNIKQQFLQTETIVARPRLVYESNESVIILLY